MLHFMIIKETIFNKLIMYKKRKFCANIKKTYNWPENVISEYQFQVALTMSDISVVEAKCINGQYNVVVQLHSTKLVL